MSDYKITTRASWARTISELEESLHKWGATEIDVNYPRGARSESFNQELEDRTVVVRYNLRGKNVSVKMDKQRRAVDNLRVIAICVESMRMNERRGMAETMESMYKQLAAPAGSMDPYQVLGMQRGFPLSVYEAMFKDLAKKNHPDVGGSDEKMKELSNAIQMIKEELSNGND